MQVAEEFICKAKGSKKVSQTKIIVSNHNWETTPSKDEIHGLLTQMQSTGADIIKFVTTAQDITDVSRVLEILAHSQVSIWSRHFKHSLRLLDEADFPVLYCTGGCYFNVHFVYILRSVSVNLIRLNSGWKYPSSRMPGREIELCLRCDVYYYSYSLVICVQLPCAFI